MGKTTIGKILAGRLGLSFFNLDQEVERHLGAPIERLKAGFLTDYMFRKEAAGVLQAICDGNQERLLAPMPFFA